MQLLTIVNSIYTLLLKKDITAELKRNLDSAALVLDSP